MTREELYREIKKIDGFIEVLQGFLKNPVCTCISHHVNNTNQQFIQENKKQLHSLINIRNFLLPLQGETDDTLAEIHYKPVKFIC
jgi:hypothetical protein